MKGIKALEGLSFALKDKWQDKIVCKSENEKHTIAELLEIVYKDLEILEIIKNWSFIEEGYKTGYGPYTKFQCIIHTIGMKEDFKKVKEWLENDK